MRSLEHWNALNPPAIVKPLLQDRKQIFLRVRRERLNPMFQTQLVILPRARGGSSQRQPEVLHNRRPIHVRIHQHVPREMVDPQEPRREAGRLRPAETLPPRAVCLQKLRTLS